MSVTTIKESERTEFNMEYITAIIKVMDNKDNTIELREKARLELLSFGYFRDIT